MTTDPFIEAAHTEVKRVYRDGVTRAHNLAMMEARGGFIAGARWARARLTAQDARVEYRATRAEAQSAIRGRAVVMYRDRARQAEARIEAIRALHNADGKRWTGFPRADEQVVYCTYCQERSPCTTIQTLDGEG